MSCLSENTPTRIWLGYSKKGSFKLLGVTGVFLSKHNPIMKIMANNKNYKLNITKYFQVFNEVADKIWS